MSSAGFVVCPECKNGRAQLIGRRLVCPEGHKFRLIKVKEVVKNG